MNNIIIPFEFQNRKIRIVVVDDEHWFVARDVAETLGYKDATTAVRSHCRGVQKLHPILDSLGRTQEVRIIREPDLYRLIVGSTLPAAVEFEAWVFEEVLPTLRREGSYGMRAAEPAPLGACRVPAEEYIALLRENNALLREKVDLLQKRLPLPRTAARPLTDGEVETIRRLKRSGLNNAEIARRVNRSPATVSMLCRDMNNQNDGEAAA